jgi:hypothetical protein
MLRGLSLTPSKDHCIYICNINALATAPPPPTASTAPVQQNVAPPQVVSNIVPQQEVAKPPETSPVGIKSLWEGVLTWPSSQNTATPYCELVAYPANRSDLDLST